jgi:hypothetical protein
MNRTALLLCLVAAAGLGCFRTQYVNLQPHGPVPHHLPVDTKPVQSESWRHYYVYGVTPEELAIRAPESCGGLAHVDRLETERNGAQGFILAASLGLNLYSPYSASVICDHGPSFAQVPPTPIEEVFPTEFSISRDYSAQYEDVWIAAVRAITEAGLALSRADRDAGIIVVPSLVFDDTQSYTIPLGHTRGAPHTVLRREGRLLLSVRPTEYGDSRVAIDVAMRIRVRTGNRDHYIPPRYEWREVRSNLSIERALLDRIEERVGALRNEVVGR